MTRAIRLSGLRASCAAAIESLYNSISKWLRELLWPDRNEWPRTLETTTVRRTFEMMQPLEMRQLLSSVGFSEGVLTLNGDSSNVMMTVKVDSTGNNVIARSGNVTKTYSKSSVTKIRMNGGSASEFMSVDSKLFVRTTFNANGGNDTIWGGSGSDTIYAGNGNDKVYGRAGNVSLNGGAGNDSLDGGAGNDRIAGSAGKNKITSGENSTSQPTSSPGTTPSPSPAPTPTPSPTPSPNPNGAGGAPNAVITAQETTIAAGHGVHVHAMDSSLGAGTVLTARFQWDFGDPSGKYNQLVGFNAAHVYDQPGKYTVTLKVTNEDGKVDTATKEITVNVAGRKKIYVSSSGSDSNSGTSESAPIKSFARVANLVNFMDNVEILFNRGDTFNVSSSVVLHGRNVLVGAYGSGDRPQLYYTEDQDHPVYFATWGNDSTIQDLTFNDPYRKASAVVPHAKNAVIRNCVFQNIRDGVNNNPNPAGVLVQDNSVPTVTSLRGYMSWAAGTDQVYLGNTVPNSTGEHCLRATGITRLLVADNNFTNLDRRSVDPNDFDKQALTVHVGKDVYVVDNTFSGGRVEFGPLGEADGLKIPGYQSQRLSYIVAEGNRFNDSIDIDHGTEHSMLRNNVIRVDNDYGIKVDAYSPTYQRGVVDLNIVNNTELTYGDSGNFLKVTGAASGISVMNNLYVGPNIKTGQNTAAPIFVSSSDLSSFTKITNNVWAVGGILNYAQGGINYVWPMWSNSTGYRTPSEWNNMPQVGTDSFPSVSQVGLSSSTFAPSSSGAAAEAGTAEPGVFTDINGTAASISGAVSAGAVQV
jgi:hypothetical protein